MSRIDELIKEKCPDGVEYKPLGQVCKIETGKLNANAAVENGKYLFFTTAKEVSHIDTFRWDTEALLIAGNANVGDVKHYIGKFEAYQRTYVLTEFSKSILPRFLYFSLKNNLKQYLDGHKNEAAMTYIVLSTLQDFRIPMPPLEIQQEIVRMLNSFTELEAELEAELTKRKQQYEHYRDHLLSFENIAGDGGQVELLTLGDIATVTKLAGFEFTKYVTYSNSGNIIALRGLNVKNGQLDLKDVKYIDKSDLSKLNRSKLVIGDMLFTYVGTVGQVALISENEKYYLAPNVSMIRLNDKNAIMPKYLMYYFQTNTFRFSQIDRLLQASSMQNIPMEKIRKFNIPVPSKKIQERIVYVLDNFDSVCNNLKIGLPAEIEARQKQYEYYRDRLLSFDAVVGGDIEREREREE